MTATPTDIRDRLRRLLLDAGCAAAGFSHAERVDASYEHQLSEWLARGCHASMDYLPRHASLRFDPREILPEARTIISVAVPYLPDEKRPQNAPQVALYAAGADYHKVIVKMLRPICRHIADAYGAATRICVDTAPIAERYWALRAGVGIRGRNGTIIIPRFGSYIFLAEILTSLELPPDESSEAVCDGCDACRRACPGQAIAPDGTIDARRCLSYLTIEHQGPYTAEQRAVLDTPAGRTTIYGCDICQRVCPHNHDVIPTPLPQFAARPAWLTLTPQTITDATPEQWDALTRGSAMRRADLATLQARLTQED